MALSFGGDAGIGVYLLVMFLVEWFYPVLFEVLRGGQTPGKRSMGLRVVNADATPISWSASLVRNLLRTADFAPAFYVGGLVSMLVSQRFQRLGDLAAETLVIHSPEPQGPAPARDADVAIEPGLGTRVSRIALTSPEQRALLDFADRLDALSFERAIEIADVLEPLTEARGEAGLRETLRIANGIAGRS